MSIQQHPDYCDGFDDARLGEPLFGGATAEYRAGWLAWYEVRRILSTMTGTIS